MKRYFFTLTISGEGNNEQEAWEHAFETFGNAKAWSECPCVPDDIETEDIDETYHAQI